MRDCKLAPSFFGHFSDSPLDIHLSNLSAAVVSNSFLGKQKRAAVSMVHLQVNEIVCLNCLYFKQKLPQIFCVFNAWQFM